MNNKKLAQLKLLLVPNIGIARYNRLISFLGEAEEIFCSDFKTLKSVEGITDDIAEYIVRNKSEIDKKAEEEIKLIEEYNVDVVFREDEEYPEPLRHIYDSPALLYMKGRWVEKDELAVAVVGSRYPSSYGTDIARRFSRELASNNITVISGMARGIDTYAHKGAVETGRTIAVLGTGINVCYPPENKELMEQIAAEGAVISEFPMGSVPERFNFPLRNRIISGLSLGVLVVEAGQKSGALITAKHAAEQGKDVFAVPGLIANPRTFGPHSLIKDGAKLVTSCIDILEEIMFYKEWKNNKLKGFNNESGFNEIENTKLSKQELLIYKLLKIEDKLQIDDICEKSCLPITQVVKLITNLEIKGVIKQLPGKFYCNLI